MILVGCVATSNLPELRALHNALEGDPDLVIVRFQARLHLGQQRLVGNLHRAAEGVAEELAAKLANERVAAQIYPASYWLSLIDIPPASEFPGTGPSGNGIAENMKSQAQWIDLMKSQCVQCHQLGTKATREIPAALAPTVRSRIARRQRGIESAIEQGRKPPPATVEYSLSGKANRRERVLVSEAEERLANLDHTIAVKENESWLNKLSYENTSDRTIEDFLAGRPGRGGVSANQRRITELESERSQIVEDFRQELERVRKEK